jgi:hypothetical protein
MTGDAVTDYGFAWGPVEVTRAALLPEDRRIITIKTPYVDLDVYVSATGRSVRIFRGGTELKGCNSNSPDSGSDLHQYDGDDGA